MRGHRLDGEMRLGVQLLFLHTINLERADPNPMQKPTLASMIL